MTGGDCGAPGAHTKPESESRIMEVNHLSPDVPPPSDCIDTTTTPGIDPIPSNGVLSLGCLLDILRVPRLQSFYASRRDCGAGLVV